MKLIVSGLRAVSKCLPHAVPAVVLVLFFSQCGNNKNGSAGSGNADTSVSKMTYWLTTGDRSALLQRQGAVGFTSSPGENAIVIDSSRKFQTMDGFGYTLTGGSAFVINRMAPQSKAALLNELFGNSDSSISVNYLRVSIGASDLDASVFSYDDMPPGKTDPNLENFSLKPDLADLIPLLKEILAINPGIKILGSPWSPPVWMKDNGSSTGGSLKPEFYGAYAKYFVKYIRGMKEQGITIDAITPQNEPLHPGNNPSLLMPAEQQAGFIKNHLGPAFAAAGIQTKIIVYDHNCNKPEYPITILNDPEAKKYVDGSAFHLYEGDISALTTVHNAHPDKNLYFTEQYTAIESKFDEDLKWHFKNLVIGAPRNWSRTVLEWNLASDASFGPHTPGGCTTCKGALTIDGSDVTRNVSYYIIGHASKFVPAGSVRVRSNMPSNLPNIAYRTPDGKTVAIVLNEGGDAVQFSLGYSGRSADVSLPSGAVATFVF